MKKHSAIVAAMLLITAFSASSQTEAPDQQQLTALQRSHKIIPFGPGKSDPAQERTDSLIQIFYEDQFRHIQDTRAPYFLMMSRDNSIAMGIGGTLQGNLSYDFDGTIEGSDFSPYSIPVPHDPMNPTRFQTGMSQTALVATIFGRSKKFGKYLLIVEGKFGGPSNTFKLKKAYITVNKITIGEAKSSFCDPSAVPATVETMGPCGAVDDTRFLVRVIQPFKNNFSIAASVEAPKDTYNILDDYTASTSAAAPNLAAYLQYGKTGNHIRLSGILKSMRYRDLIKSDNNYVTGYGVNLSTKYHLLPSLVLYGAANYGKGIGSMVNDLGCGDNDLLSYTTTSSKAGKMYAPESLGWYAALEYRFSPSVFSTVVFSQDRIYTKHDSDYSDGSFRYGMYAVANIFWDITPRIELGAEFDWGRRVDFNGQGADAHRFALSGAFSF